MTLRIVGGDLKGIHLIAPKTPNTRPTRDMVREAIFNILGDLVVDARVLDLYAGSGAMGLEALSRGAAHVDFVESGAAACDAIRENIRRTKMEPMSTLRKMPVKTALVRLSGSYGVVFLDPPYEAEGITEVMETLGEGTRLDTQAHAILEHGKRFEPLDSYGSLTLSTRRRYGDTSVSVYCLRVVMPDGP